MFGLTATGSESLLCSLAVSGKLQRREDSGSPTAFLASGPMQHTLCHRFQLLSLAFAAHVASGMATRLGEGTRSSSVHEAASSRLRRILQNQGSQKLNLHSSPKVQDFKLQLRVKLAYRPTSTESWH